MHIVFLNRSFWPDITATGQLLTELCEDLVKDYNCQVTVIVGRPLIREDRCLVNNFGINLIKRENFKGIEILRVRSTTLSPHLFLNRIFNYLSYFILCFLASFKIKRPDIIVTLTDPPIINLVGLCNSWRFGIPWIISCQDIFPEAARGLPGAHNKIINFILDKIIRFCFKKATHVVSLGRIMQKKLVEEKGLRRDKVSIISNWEDCSKIFPVSKNNPFSIAHNLTDFFVVMYSGNMGASSGLEILIESAYLLKDYKDILFVFIGEGIMKKRLIELTQNYNLKNVRFFPCLSKENLAQPLSSADVLVIPLKKGLSGYSVPSKLYGALASGRPYVACIEEESEISKITERFKCGLLAKPEDPQDLSKKIIFLYENEDLRLKMGENSRYAAQFFDRKIGVRSYYELFQKLAHIS